MSDYKDPKDLTEISKERLEFEIDNKGHQIQNWKELFDLISAINKYNFGVLDRWIILSNRYLLMEREHLSAHKLFTKEEVFEMIAHAYKTGWGDCLDSQTDTSTVHQKLKTYLKTKKNI